MARPGRWSWPYTALLVTASAVGLMGLRLASAASWNAERFRLLVHVQGTRHYLASLVTVAAPVTLAVLFVLAFRSRRWRAASPIYAVAWSTCLAASALVLSRALLAAVIVALAVRVVADRSKRGTDDAPPWSRLSAIFSAAAVAVIAVTIGAPRWLPLEAVRLTGDSAVVGRVLHSDPTYLVLLQEHAGTPGASGVRVSGFDVRRIDQSGVVERVLCARRGWWSRPTIDFSSPRVAKDHPIAPGCEPLRVEL